MLERILGVDSDLNKYLVDKGKIDPTLLKPCKVPLEPSPPRRKGSQLSKSGTRDLRVDDLSNSINVTAREFRKPGDVIEKSQRRLSQNNVFSLNSSRTSRAKQVVYQNLGNS